VGEAVDGVEGRVLDLLRLVGGIEKVRENAIIARRVISPSCSQPGITVSLTSRPTGTLARALNSRRSIHQSHMAMMPCCQLPMIWSPPKFSVPGGDHRLSSIISSSAWTPSGVLTIGSMSSLKYLTPSGAAMSIQNE
jgi:hypothetical protein